MNNLLLLTEAGENIGFGHLSRCSSIYQFVKDKNITSELLLDCFGETLSSGNFTSMHWLQDIGKLKEYINRFKNVLIDSYKISEEDLNWCITHFENVYIIDDYGRLSFGNVKLIINPNIFGSNISYKSKSVGGADYVILREAFRKCSDKSVIKTEISSILITVGGSDYRHLLPKLVESFKKLNYHFNIICGNDTYSKELSKNFGSLTNFTFHGFLNDVEMRDLLLRSDIAVSAGGQTLHELAFLGVPTIAICIDKDQEPNINSYFKAGFLDAVLFWNQPDLSETITDKLQKFTYPIRQNYFNIGTGLINGNGVFNIYKSLIGS